MSLEIISLLSLLLLLAIFILSGKIELDIISIMLLIIIIGIQEFSNLDLLPKDEIFQGFSSPLVIAIIGITIISGTMEKTGFLNPLIQSICRFGRQKESNIIILICLISGLTSAFIQNIAAVALMIPIVKQVSKQTETPISLLMMPMAFCAVLGGSLTMIGASPTIFLQNYYDLNRTVHTTVSLTITSVTGIGAVLLCMGIVFFTVYSRKLLPIRKHIQTNTKSLSYFQKAYGLKAQFYFTIKNVSALKEPNIGSLEDTYGLSVIGYKSDECVTSPVRAMTLKNGDIVAAISTSSKTDMIFEADFARLTSNHFQLKMALDPERMGIAEIVIRPTSSINNQTIRELRFRTNFGLNTLAIIRANGTYMEDIRNVKLQIGDTLVCHGKWVDFRQIQQAGDFAVLDRIPSDNKVEYGRKRLRFVLSLAFVALFFTTLPLAVTLLSTAFLILLFGIVTSREAYNMVSWKTVFFLSGMIPFGHALEHTGTVQLLADFLQLLLDDSHFVVAQLVLAIVSVIAGAILSNVGAAIVLIPLAVIMSGGDNSLALIYALIVSVSVSNSFFISSHQVNMLIAYPGKYTNRDFLRVGSIFTVLSILFTILAVNIFY